MFKYLINGELVTFSSQEERESGLNDATANGYSIERVGLDYEEKKEEPKKKEEKDPILESIEANTPKEDFTQGPVERADAASKTVAPDDAESLLATSSSVSREEDLRQPEPEPDPIFAPEPKFITDALDRGNLQGEVNQIETSLQDFGFSQSEEGKEALKRQQLLQSKLDETVLDRMYSIQKMPVENQKEELSF